MKLFLLFIVMGLVLVAGCSTPEGGSSLPWSQPESWEHDIGIGTEY